MKVEYINPILEATINLFDKTFGIVPEAGKPFILERSTAHRWDVSGVMVLTGKVIGVVVIRLTRHLSVKLLQRACIEFETDDEREELTNGLVGELINVISGNAATQLSDFNIKVSVPFVVQGMNHSVMWPERVPIIGIPFNTPYGPFLVNISLMESGVKKS